MGTEKETPAIEVPEAPARRPPEVPDPPTRTGTPQPDEAPADDDGDPATDPEAAP